MLPPADGHDWLSLTGDDGSTWLVDVTFLTSGYACIYGSGCPGIEQGQAEVGCCNHGAHFSDGADRRTTARHAARMRPDEWQHHRRAEARGGPFKRAPGGGWMTRLVDGACIFLNGADHPGGSGCSLHQAALARGERPMDWKPDVCWQVPVRLDIHTDDYDHDTYLLRAWERRDWGPGGAEFDWWCIEQEEAHHAPDPVYRSMAAELAELMGDALYQRLCRTLDQRRGALAPTGATPVTLAAPAALDPTSRAHTRGRAADGRCGMEFTAANLRRATEANDLLFPPHVVDQLVAALDSGKHVILTGPPGTGKTTLAYAASELAQKAMLCTGYLPTTASSEWTTYETIGGLQPSSDGLIFRPGLFLEAVQSGAWLIIDELNRANFDRAFGPFFTVLSGSPVVLPYKRAGRSQPISLVPQAVEPPPHTDVIRVPSTWRIVATMNVFDKNLLYDMSYALMRRFAFIEVGCPDDDVYRSLLTGPGTVIAELLMLRKLTDLGPAVYLDAARYVNRRAKDGVTRSRALYEVFYAYFLPQFEGFDDDKASELYRMLEPLLDPPERLQAQRTIAEMLGVELVI